MPSMPQANIEGTAPPVNPEPQEVVEEEKKQGEKRPAENESEAIPFKKKLKNAPKVEAEKKKDEAANKVLEIKKMFELKFSTRSKFRSKLFNTYVF